MKRTLANIILATAVFATGYCVGTRSERSNVPTYANLPVAKGFLDVPNTYTLEIRPNMSNEREIYIQDKNRGIEWPLIEQSIPLTEAYMGNGKYVMEGAMGTVAASRKMLSVAGINTYAPARIMK